MKKHPIHAIHTRIQHIASRCGHVQRSIEHDVLLLFHVPCTNLFRSQRVNSVIVLCCVLVQDTNVRVTLRLCWNTNKTHRLAQFWLLQAIFLIPSVENTRMSACSYLWPLQPPSGRLLADFRLQLSQRQRASLWSRDYYPTGLLQLQGVWSSSVGIDNSVLAQNFWCY